MGEELTPKSVECALLEETPKPSLPSRCPVYHWNSNNEWVQCCGLATATGCCGEEHALELFTIAENDYCSYIDFVNENDVDGAQRLYVTLKFKSMMNKTVTHPNKRLKMSNECASRIKNIFNNVYVWKNVILPFMKDVDFSKCEMYTGSILHELEKKCIGAVNDEDDLDEAVCIAKRLRENARQFFSKIQTDYTKKHMFLQKNMEDRCDVITRSLDTIVSTLCDYSNKKKIYAK